MRQRMVVSVLVGALLLSGGAVSAQEPETTQDRTRIQTQEQEQIYGSQLMTPEERAQYRERMRSAATAEERERVRREHHELMRQRATERGVTLPEEPPARPGGMMRRDGMGSGGGGMGPGTPGMGRGMGPSGGGRGR